MLINAHVNKRMIIAAQQEKPIEGSNIWDYHEGEITNATFAEEHSWITREEHNCGKFLQTHAKVSNLCLLYSHY